MTAQQAGAAGASVAAWAQEARDAARGGPWRAVLRFLGLDVRGARAEAVAARRDAGAAGEQLTAALIDPLSAKRWAVLHDRALPRGRANVDHVLVPPAGDCVVLVDSKLWSRRRGTVQRSNRGELRHGREDREAPVGALLYERQTLRDLLRVDVVTVMCVHSAPVAGAHGRFELPSGIVVTQADGLLDVLRQNAGTYNARAHARLAAAAEAALPPHTGREAR